MKNDKVLIFVHIPKTGGSTIRGIISRQYSKRVCHHINKANLSEFIAWPQYKKDNIKVLEGHRIFGFHEYFSSKAFYFTMLRNPVERVISSYYYNLYRFKYSSDELHKKLFNYSLKDYVQSGTFPNVENRQVRILSGNLDIPYNTCTVDMLKIAKRNIDEQFDLVGVSEYFDEFLIMLMMKLKWRYPFYGKLNVTRNRPKKNDIDKNILQVIEKYNQLDIELYQYVKKKFENQIAQRKTIYFKKLKTFKKLNQYFELASGIKNFLMRKKG